jgi:hypothetical protein
MAVSYSSKSKTFASSLNFEARLWAAVGSHPDLTADFIPANS